MAMLVFGHSVCSEENVHVCDIHQGVQPPSEVTSPLVSKQIDHKECNEISCTKEDLVDLAMPESLHHWSIVGTPE